ncbi:hypothetical protein ASPWEDRAFT_40641 [Aspergillus wentii DTO 134E9]|uniref:NADH:flavin oxidoreductase/NADH oxidase N-terminal domain-containing protein n=1 Tax=Aspergillus wentii DTO 134E9 TaxID=1073089 RepID=A0A1L9RKI8_ASPWE|nr:uncharacterized protein ASPWEDRAFT_40641 [Aspergillus wentii DTO 134E9]OJJ35442.1 hypothetical protein ASPWEDRAFT_40641 [Aspergillus wentii DTO 134E9]
MSSNCSRFPTSIPRTVQARNKGSKRGPPLKNRLLPAPLTNWQSNDDGTITTHDLDWLTRCAAGGFSMVITCAAHIHPHGQAFPDQLDIHDDIHLPGMRRLANTIRHHGGISSVQLPGGGCWMLDVIL